MEPSKLIPVTLFFDAAGGQVLNINYGPNAAPGINISLPIDHVYGIKIAPLTIPYTLNRPMPRLMICVNEFASDAFNSLIKYHFVLEIKNYETSVKLNNNGEYWFAKPFLPPSSLSFTFSNGVAPFSSTDPFNTNRVIIPIVFYCTRADYQTNSLI